MPYIVKEQRDVVDPSINQLNHAIQQVGGQVDGVVNYTISNIVAVSFNPTGGRWSYFMIVRAMGAFVCAAFEFYRRVAAPKEDQAITENGDIGPYEN